MNPVYYLLIAFLLVAILFYPLVRKAVALFDIYVHKYVRQATDSSGEKQEEANGSARTLIHLKLLAYERIILLIERLKPDSLIPRTLSVALNVKEYQLALLNEIRQEYEYNLSQQLYLSDAAWSAATNFKDSVIALINSAAAACDAGENAGVLAKKILSLYIGSDLKADEILQVIKAEIR